MKTPKEQVIEYVEKRYQKEKEKWSDGLRNQYFDIKCKSIAGKMKNSKHFALNGTLEVEDDK